MQPQVRAQPSAPPPEYSKYPNYTSMRQPMPQTNARASQASEQQRSAFNRFIGRYEINRTFAEKLRGLDGYEIVFICDDSGSMNTELSDVATSYGHAPTRWDEMKRTVSIVVDLATTLDPDGVDIFFLNRESMRNVRSSKELEATFAVPPEGGTPLVPIVRQVLEEKRHFSQNEKLLILIATDGVPTDYDGNPNIEEFRRVLERERVPTNMFPVTIIACTDDDQCMSYLNDWDKKIGNLDGVDDYKTEKQEILAVQGPSFPFSYGDYVVKILMGGIDPWFDELDEVKVSVNNPKTSLPAQDPRYAYNSNSRSKYS